jgi:hypothetical protein
MKLVICKPQEIMMNRQFLMTLLLVIAPASALAGDDFSKLDANGDGQLTVEELTAGGLNWSKEQFTAADTDSSGALSQSEYEAVAN